MKTVLKKGSISIKFNSVAVLGMTLILTIFGYLNYHNLKKELYSELKHDTELLMSRMQLSLPIAVWNYQTDQMDKTLDSELPNYFAQQIRIFEGNAEENLLFGKFKNASGQIQQTPEETALSNLDTENTVRVPLMFSDEYTEETQVGIAVLNVDDTSVIHMLKDALIRLVWQTLILELLMIALITFLCRTVVTNPLNKITSAMKNIAEGEGNLTQRLEPSNGEIGQLSHYFNHFVQNIQEVVISTNSRMDEMVDVCERLYKVAEESTNRVQEQRAETEMVATATQEMTSTSEEVAKSAQDAASSASNSAEKVRQAQSVLSTTIQSVMALAGEIKSGESAVAKVRSDVGNISTVLDVIGSIADQTNLLALNAAIEAARAGEQGRGFAVVADEVRSLAQRTQESTEEVYNMLNLLQTGADDAVNEITSAKTQSDDTVNSAKQAGDSIDAIGSDITIINDMNTQIAQAVYEQTSVNNDISSSLSRISMLADESAQDVQKAQESAAQVQQLSSQVRHQLNKFKVN